MAFRTLPTHEFPLYQGDDQERLAELDRAVKIAEQTAQADNARVGDGDENSSVIAARRAFNEFVAEVAERTPVLVWQLIGNRRFRDVMLEHPPRMVDGEPDESGKVEKVTHPEDAGFDVDTSTFPRAILTFRDGDVRTILTPEFDTKAACEDFVDNELTPGEYERLWVQMLMSHQGMTVHPKLLPHYDVTPPSGETSTLQPASD